MKSGKLTNMKKNPKYIIGKRWGHNGYQNTLKVEWTGKHNIPKGMRCR